MIKKNPCNIPKPMIKKDRYFLHYNGKLLLDLSSHSNNRGVAVVVFLNLAVDAFLIIKFL